MARDDINSLPLYPRLDEVADAFARSRLLLLSAEPGAGKTTLVPWRLLAHPEFAVGKILLLEPRRIAARAAADRIAELLGEVPGKTVGLRTRYESVVSPSSRLEVVTDGVLVRIIQSDQALGGYGTIIFDEFHERGLMAVPHHIVALGQPIDEIYATPLKRAVETAEIIATAAQHLASYQKPRSVDFVDSLPKAPTGKILKRALRAPYWESRGSKV